MIKPSWEENEGFIKKGLSSGLSWSQLNAKTQKSLRCESKKPTSTPQKSGQKKESQIQYPVLDLLQKIQEMKKWANDSTGCPLIRSEGTPLYRKNGLVFPKLKDLNYERKLERSEL